MTPILLFGSTRPGDEALAAECWRSLARDFPQWRLVVVPRHLPRVDDAVRAFGRENCALRTETLKPGRRAETRVLVVDTLGELGVFYGLAEVAVIGVPCETLGERVCACVAPVPGHVLTLEVITDYLRTQRIAVYKLPEHLMVLPELPRNPVGKLLKRELRQRFAA